jgi:NADPH:quinone reductase-like Zn-dependent oxidoreductase
VLQLWEVEKPNPEQGEVLIKVHAARVARGDVVLRGVPRADDARDAAVRGCVPQADTRLRAGRRG